MVTPRQFEDLTGRRYGQWVVEERDLGPKRIAYFCVCDCGNRRSVKADKLKSGESLSCGHAPNQSKVTHGKSRRGAVSKMYKVWSNMIQRCTNSNHNSYHHYGGRGIQVCEEWLKSFEAFETYIGPRPTPQHSIDRYPDNNGNYAPGNVRWATKSEQRRNQRKIAA
ncbi:hypothetical protein AC629_13580 [Bradyrhizobium sp. NAS80.1]|uniref:hypothetical protein n=1 Tax=Bradyrhizobium sp. NAS80.1 TaxID=1680159 RepID=UPI000963A8AA|nr:hypothetical protein [Bradyrhizobium sp. NAS80.1]OKO87567.1 hypothetical protein AC629_13580 [Bradyrhizobium sp. NAS80.1]